MVRPTNSNIFLQLKIKFYLTVLYLSFSNLVHASLVLDNVSIQLGASSCIAAAHAIHEGGNTAGILLYVLASQSTEVSWDVGDLQVFSQAKFPTSVSPDDCFNIAVGD